VNTPSHFLLHAAIAKRADNSRLIRSAFLWGALTPDIPLLALAITSPLYFRSQGMPFDEAMPYIFETLYFKNPYWISAHHLFHAPLLLLLYALVLYPFRKNRVVYWLLWFVAGCALHSFVDILTHYDDGPLVFFPLNWSYRFYSISYWDKQHGAGWFMWFELALDVCLLGYLMVPWTIKKLKIKSKKGDP
jgi:membrane-bound metal-dependent hydrolase YbcI (DUF457 family)